MNIAKKDNLVWLLLDDRVGNRSQVLGIGKALNIPEGLIAGAILSGAYFGDKMSPLSDTTNLAPAMAGSDLFTHIKYLSITTFPSIIISLIIFIIMGMNISSDVNIDNASLISSSILEKFYISPILFLVPFTVIFLIYKKIKAVPSLFVGVVLGSVFALIFQPDLVREVSGNLSEDWTSLFIGIMKSLYGSISISTSNELVSDLLSSSGMYGMLGTIWLVVSAMIFGGVMDKAGFLNVISSLILTVLIFFGMQMLIDPGDVSLDTESFKIADVTMPERELELRMDM